MILHFGFELPVPASTAMNHETPGLTQEEMRIIKKQIRQNADMANRYVAKLELFVNHEGHSPEAPFVEKIRKRLELLMEENDTFRKVLWAQYQKEEMMRETHRHFA